MSFWQNDQSPIKWPPLSVFGSEVKLGFDMARGTISDQQCCRLTGKETGSIEFRFKEPACDHTPFRIADFAM